jgi:hypothetical protein
MFQRNILPPSSVSKSKPSRKLPALAGFLLGLIFSVEYYQHYKAGKKKKRLKLSL